MMLKYISSASPRYLADGTLEHHGIKGMHWGVRRFRNLDGTLTAAGRRRYGFKGTGKHVLELEAEMNDLRDEGYRRASRKLGVETLESDLDWYAKLHGINKEDGSGGNDYSREVYKQKKEIVERLDREAWARAEAYVKGKMDSKYGKYTYEAVKDKMDEINNGITLVSSLLALIGTVGVATVQAYRNRH